MNSSGRAHPHPTRRTPTRRLAALLIATVLPVVMVAVTVESASAAPQNTTPPSITGVPSVGETLTGSDGSWGNRPGTGVITYLGQWEACASAGCAIRIRGASSYAVTTADLGMTIRYCVTATDAAGSTGPVCSLSTGVVTPIRPPVNRELPTVTGTNAVGATFTGGRGAWEGGNPLSFALRWEACEVSTCTPRGSGVSYTSTLGDLGYRIRLCVDATNAAGTASACSAPTDALTKQPPTVITAPSVGGVLTVGEKLTANRGTWTAPAGENAYSLEWFRCTDANQCVLVAALPGYELVAADVDQRIKVCVRAENLGGTSTSCSLASSPVVDKPAPVKITQVALVGKVAMGRTVKVMPMVSGYPKPTTMVEWFRCLNVGKACTRVSSDPTYTIGPDDSGHRMRVVVTAKNQQSSDFRELELALITVKPDLACGVLDPWSDPDGDEIPTILECNAVVPTAGQDIFFDLPTLGASPRRKDIFLELDRMDGLNWNPAAVRMVVDAFNQAPVSNPDGTQGISLHVDYGPKAPTGPNTTQTWGLRSRAGVVPWQKVIKPWADVDTIKKTHFDSIRSYVFHYGLFAHRYGDAKNSSSGLARGGDMTPSGLGQDFLVTFGGWCEGDVLCDGTTEMQAGTLMHEFGHILGLGHGGRDANAGADSQNYKPNYLSVMNYFWQISGLLSKSSAPIYDYSRYDSAALPDLDENNLNELSGVPQSTPVPFSTAVNLCPKQVEETDSSGKVVKVWQVTTVERDFGQAVDFNCSGSAKSKKVAVDITRDGATDGRSVLKAHSDWDKLIYSGGNVGGAGQSAIHGIPDQELLTIDPPADLGAVPSPIDLDADATYEVLIKPSQVFNRDAIDPTITVKLKRANKGAKQVKARLVARDAKGMNRLDLRINGLTPEDEPLSVLAPPKARRKVLTIKQMLKAGRYRFTAVAYDRTGNIASLAGRLVITCPKAGACVGTAKVKSL